MKYLQLGMVDESLQLAIQTSNLQLLQECRLQAKLSKDVTIMNLIDYHMEKTNP